MTRQTNTFQKALSINLDSNIYGAFAEIGAGQEVARWFFRVGGAAGTLAKTMSAYDMKVSDDIYGKSDRYVSRDRLKSMLDHEYGLLLERLGSTRSAETRFFAFADTISARNFKGTNQCHGWLGVRFQHTPGGEPHDILLHVNLKDSTNLLQQEAVGVLGVNLIYAAFNYLERPAILVKSLLDELSLARLDLDLIKRHRPNLDEEDDLSLGYKMIEQGVSTLLMFSPDGSLLVPSETLYKRPLLIERGAFRKVQVHHHQLLNEASAKMQSELASDAQRPLAVFDLCVGRMSRREVPETEQMPVSEEQFSSCLRPLLQFGCPVIVSRYAEYYRLVQYLRGVSKEPLGFVMGIGTMIRMLDPGNYAHLEGNILEALGRLVSLKVRFYVQSMEQAAVDNYLKQHGLTLDGWETNSTRNLSVESIAPRSALSHLYAYLCETRVLASLEA